jgi:cytochrome c oxidase accessory protein FixG
MAKGSWSASMLLRRAGKHAVWVGLSLLLAHTFLGYFMPVREVVAEMTASPAAHPTAFGFVLALTALVYLNFAWFREQMCIVVCPYGRLQGVLYDRDTVNVGYDAKRGEPRGRPADGARGECIDCRLCIAVCPTGIDIRNGTQLECLGCANCIDACDRVMDRLGRPRGLIRYDSQNGFESGVRRFWRPRVILYGVLLAAGTAVFAVAAGWRTPFEADLVRVQGSAYTLAGERVRNAFTLHLVNKTPGEVRFTLVPAPDHRLAWTIPVPALTLPSLADQRLPLFVEFSRADLPGGGMARLDVASDAGSRAVPVRLLGPDGGRKP